MTQHVLAAASSGGHVAELHALVPRMVGAGTPVDWVTVDTPQTRSLLDGEPVSFVRPIRPRQVVPATLNIRRAFALLRATRYDAVVGCGATALSFLPLARSMGIPAHFVETATRTDGPSLTGRLLGAVPGVRRYTQHPGWAKGRWLYRGSVLDGFECSMSEREPAVRRVVVTVGMNSYPFRRLFERLLAILPDDAEVFWQSGYTDVSGLPLAAQPAVPADELSRAMAAADVVVAHAGVGSALAALGAGKAPVLVPRLKAHGEQVDDHQCLLAHDIAARGLAVTATVDELELGHLEQASRLDAVRRANPLPFELA